ncbi:hypothetical protein O6H91_02G002000 [Diphasiastrum complanatum]|uniref:Uncharacterized protein n=1 Tax=Diphasiastrum complanatum TaxID=34168 RepID=A0ACC2EC85_DIPCM|nr:hypothetical protein O6H91_Y146200 [Diphasiastrum complanatum]KAJ7564101.1 hypothetical protein O6H91_02G002000 [Diphasiastrum complanatum]
MWREWMATPCLMGIDEAGRGPVLGPMVYGCAYCPLIKKEELGSMQFADSKTLTEAKRQELFECIKADSSMAWAVDVIDPKDLSAQMLQRERRSLNVISYESAKGLINCTLNLGVHLAEVFVDTVGDAEKYQAWLTERFPQIKFTVSKKADSLFPIVSAASIVAKVTRDRSLRDWKLDETLSTISRDFGSGYPADPETKAWLLQHKDAVFGFPSLVRFSWATCKPLISAGGVEVYWEADEADEDSAKRKSHTVEVESNASARHSYFRSRQLQQVTTRL